MRLEALKRPQPEALPEVKSYSLGVHGLERPVKHVFEPVHITLLSHELTAATPALVAGRYAVEVAGPGLAELDLALGSDLRALEQTFVGLELGHG